MTLEEFLRDNVRNAWIEVGPYEVYLRHGFHVIRGEMIETLDIANIVNQVEQTRGRGGFVMLLMVLEEMLAHQSMRHRVQALYVESVLNEGLGNLLEKIEFEKIANTPPCYVKKLSEIEPSNVWNDKIKYLERMKEG